MILLILNFSLWSFETDAYSSLEVRREIICNHSANFYNNMTWLANNFIGWLKTFLKIHISEYQKTQPALIKRLGTIASSTRLIKWLLLYLALSTRCWVIFSGNGELTKATEIHLYRAYLCWSLFIHLMWILLSSGRRDITRWRKHV